MKKVLQHLSYLLLLSSSKSSKQKKELIKTATREQLKAIFESVANILHGNLELKPSLKAKLKTKSNFFHKLTDKKVSVKRKINLMLKHEKELALFLSPLTKLLISRV